jgi:8-oxo-dGTP pyrophosphatase MutT (NUDIX family)
MTPVVSCILEHNGAILLLKRSDKVRTYKGKWGAVTGYVEEYETPIETAYKEISEEVSISPDAIELVKKGDPVQFFDNVQGQIYEWKIYPFLFHVKKVDTICIDWEHTMFRWISPSDITQYTTVPRLQEIVKVFFP